jgi:hypothetical protein
VAFSSCRGSTHDGFCGSRLVSYHLYFDAASLMKVGHMENISSKRHEDHVFPASSATPGSLKNASLYWVPAAQSADRASPVGPAGNSEA